MSPKRYYGDFAVGDTAESIGRTVSESEVYRFAGLAGTYGEVHTNRAYVRERGLDGPVAQGILALAYINGLRTTTGWNPAVITLYGLDDVRFVEPLYVGDTVHLESEVVGKELRDDDSGLVTFEERLVTEDGTVTVASNWLNLIERT